MLFSLRPHCRKTWPVLLLALAVQFEGSQCGAQHRTLFGVKNNFPSSAELIRINPNTAKGTVVGPIGFQNVSHMTYDPVTDTIFGVRWSPGGPNDLITIDPISGAGTIVGQIGFNFVSGLAYDPLSAKLLGLDNALISSDLLLEINRNTGVGTSTLLNGLEGANGLVFDAAGTPFAIDTGDTDMLITIDFASGIGTAIGPIGFDQQIVDLAIDPLTGILYGVDIDTDALLTLNTNSGVATSIGPIGFSVAGGLVFVPVPEPSSFLLSLVGVAWLAYRKSKCNQTSLLT